MTVLTPDDKAPYTPIINLIAAPLGASVQFVLLEGTVGGAALSQISQPQNEGNSTIRIPSADDIDNATFGLLANRVGLFVISAPYVFDGTTFSRGTGGLWNVAAPTLANQVGQDVRSLSYALDASTATDAVQITGDVGTVNNPTLANVNGQDVRAFLYALDEDTGTQAVRLRASAAGNLRTDATIPATVTTAADFVTVAATVSTLIAVNTARKVAIVQNLDAIDSVRVGDSNIGAARGIIIAPGESVTLETTAAISVFPVAGTPAVSRTEIEA